MTVVYVIFVYCVCILYFVIFYSCVSNDVFPVFFIFYLIILVTWTGNFSLFVISDLCVLLNFPEVRRFFRQPTAWHVSLFGTTGYFICRGNKCIFILNMHNCNWNYICKRHGIEVREEYLGWMTDNLNSWLQLCH